MCSLYSFRKSAAETRSLLDYLEQPDFPPREVITPGSPIAIVRDESGARHFALVRWGFVPSWAKEIQPGKPLVNARAETILEKATFRNAIRRRRCLVPADGFYEWKGDVLGRKVPHFIHKRDHSLFAFAGIWEHWVGPDGSELESAAIITTEPNKEMAEIHTRMPVILESSDHARWLDVANIDAKDIVQLLRPAPDGTLTAEPTVALQRKPSTPKPTLPKPQMDLF
jgi:putative SOS response-associated peptidase YedK